MIYKRTYFKKHSNSANRIRVTSTRWRNLNRYWKPKGDLFMHIGTVVLKPKRRSKTELKLPSGVFPWMHRKSMGWTSYPVNPQKEEWCLRKHTDTLDLQSKVLANFYG